MNLEIYNYLKKYYLKFDKDRFKKLLETEFNEDQQIMNIFKKIWKKEHGGLYSLANPFEGFVPPEILPYEHNGYIFITDTGSNSKSFQKKYVKTLNNLILNTNSDELNLDFYNNNGGKPAVMIAGLLPILNNFDKKILSYYYDKNDKRHKDIIHLDNKIICISNHNETVSGTSKKKMFKTINIFYNKYTQSSAEQAIICLISLSKYIKPVIFI